MFERIVVGLDGSQVSEIALHMGAELARRLGLPLHLVRVADLAVVPWGANQAAAAYAELSRRWFGRRTRPTRYLETVAQPLRARASSDHRGPIRARGAGVGRCRGTIDLLVVASHGRHGLERLVLGSVAEEVAERSRHQCS